MLEDAAIVIGIGILGSVILIMLMPFIEHALKKLSFISDFLGDCYYKYLDKVDHWLKKR